MSGRRPQYVLVRKLAGETVYYAGQASWALGVDGARRFESLPAARRKAREFLRLDSVFCWAGRLR